MAGEVIDEAYVAVKAQVDPGFAADVNKSVQQALKGVGQTVNNSLKPVGASVRGAIQKPVQDAAAGAASSLSAVDRAAKTTFSNVERSAQGAGTTITTSFKGALGGVLAGFGTLGGIQVFSGFVRDAVTASDAVNKFKSSLDFAGLSHKEIDALTASTQKYADETVYDLATIQGATAQLAANGVKGPDLLVKALGNLNAVGGGTPETFQRVNSVLTQTAGAGKLTTENWNQLSDAIPGAAGVIQKQLLKAGAYTGNFRDEMAKGAITSDEFNKALMVLGDNPAAKKAATSTKTLEGAVGNLQATIVGKLQKAIDVLKPSITNALGAATTQFGKVADALGKAFTSPAIQNIGKNLGAIFKDLAPVLGFVAKLVGGVLVVAFKVLVPVVDAVVSALAAVVGFVTRNIEFFKIFAATLLVILSPMLALVGALGLFIGALRLFSIIQTVIKGVAAFNAVLAANPIGIVVIAIAALVAGLIYAYKHSEKFRAIVDKIGQVLAGAFKASLDAVSTAISVVGGWITKGIKWMTDFGKSINDFITKAVKFFAALPGKIGSALSSLGSKVGQIFSKMFTSVRSMVSTGIANIVQFFTQLPGKIVALGSKLVSAGKSLITKLFSGIGSAASFISGVTRKIRSAIGSITIPILHKTIAQVIPGFARGTIVRARAGGILARLGEGGGDEAVVPLGSGYARDAARIVEASGLLNRADILRYLTPDKTSTTLGGGPGSSRIAPVTARQYPPSAGGVVNNNDNRVINFTMPPVDPTTLVSMISDRLGGAGER